MVADTAEELAQKKKSVQVVSGIYWKCQTEEKYSRNHKGKNPSSQQHTDREPALVKIESQRALRDSQRMLRGAILTQQKQMLPRVGGEAELNSLSIMKFPSHRSNENLPASAGIRTQERAEKIERVLVPTRKPELTEKKTEMTPRVGAPCYRHNERSNTLPSDIENPINVYAIEKT